MNREQVLQIVLDCIRYAQDRIPDISRIEVSEGTCPLEDIEKFDSKRWPAVRDLIAIRLGISLKGDNIFREGRSTPRTIGRIADHLLGIVNSPNRSGAAA